MVFDRTVLMRDLLDRIFACSNDELRVVNRVLEGIEQGRESYGPLDIANDRRLFGSEVEQELRDAIFYMSVEYIAREDIRRERVFDAEQLVAPGLEELKTAEPVTAPRARIEFDTSEDE